MSGPSVDNRPVSVHRWLDDEVARFREDEELAAEIAVDGRPAVIRRACDRVLGEPAPPSFLELGDGRVVELGGDPPATGGGAP